MKRNDIDRDYEGVDDVDSEIPLNLNEEHHIFSDSIPVHSLRKENKKTHPCPKCGKPNCLTHAHYLMGYSCPTCEQGD